MAGTMDTQVPTESTLSSSEVKREEAQKKAQKKAELIEKNKARNEAALAAMAASYGKRYQRSATSPGEFARYFEAIRDGKELKFTEEILETVKALQPAIDYYTKLLPWEFLLLPVFSENESSHFGPLPPVADKDVRLFQRALHRLQSICEVTRQSDQLLIHAKTHYYDDRDKVSPYSHMELSQAKMLYEMFFYRMFQVCDKYLEKIERSRFRPDPGARKKHDKEVIHGIVCHGLQFMHEFETQTTDKVREELIRKIAKDSWFGPRFYLDPRFQDTKLQEELCATQRIFDNKLGYIPRGCRSPCRECNYHKQELPLPPSPEMQATIEAIRTRVVQMKKLLECSQVPAEETQSGQIHPDGDN
ncbi:unnamed protein product [Clonostachys rhizophaga]|uniref:Uncharacterized protein n=1 Tax=Clonostachys rhizophaga TaxID=160324 RepID=A0A9N9VTV0_9HYPO|nr:unnamed protein product [Clonostachys rhizophaga]